MKIDFTKALEVLWSFFGSLSYRDCGEKLRLIGDSMVFSRGMDWYDSELARRLIRKQEKVR